MFDFFWGVKEVKEGREGKDKCFGRPRCMHCYCTLLLYFFFVVKETGDKEIRQMLWSTLLLVALVLSFHSLSHPSHAPFTA